MKRFLFGLGALLWSTLAQAGVPCTLPFNLQNNTTADATQVMANYNALVTCLGNAAAAGANSDITALLGLTTPLPYTAGGSSVYIGGTSTGSGNAQVVASPTPLGFTLTVGKSIIFVAGFSNVVGSATQLNVNGTGLKNVAHPIPGSPGTELLTGGEIAAGALVQAFYDGTQYVVLNTVNQLGGVGPLFSIASAATTEVATATSHNLLITGTASITSFGATASLNEPLYQISFNGAATITFNQTTCSTVGGCILTPGNANIITAANDTATLQYLGNSSGGGGNWQVTSYSRVSGAAVVNPTPLCGAVGLRITNNAGTPATQLDVAADSLVMINPTGNIPVYRTSVSFTINLTNTNVVNGSDGARPTSAWTNIYAIDNGTTTGGYASTNAAGVFATTPTGYTYRCRLGAMRLNGSQNLLRTLQVGPRATYSVISGVAGGPATPLLASGPAGTFSLTGPSWASVSVSTAVPPTATRLLIALNNDIQGGTLSSIVVAPNSNWLGPQGTFATTTGTPTFMNLNAGSGQVQSGEILLEGTTIVWAADQNGGGIFALGWVDKVNAN